MRETLELAKECGVSEATIYLIAKRLHEIEGGETYRLPTKEEVMNRKQLFGKTMGRPKKYKERENDTNNNGNN